MTDYTKLAAVYADRTNAEAIAISDAVAAVRNGSCPSPVVILALDTLVHTYELQASEWDIGIVERYVAEAWGEWQRPTGAVYKDPVKP